MNTNDDTIYQPKVVEDRKKEKEESANTTKKDWQRVVIGGVSGIFMGAAAMYATNAYAQENSESNDPASTGESHVAENGLKIADVDQSLSFGEAFAQAREAVGPGGVFHWHGGIYNTFTEAEWNNMTPAERSEFAHQVAPEIQGDEGNPNHYSSNHQSSGHQHTDDHHGSTDNENIHHASNNRNASDVRREEETEPEVHIIGQERIQTDEGGYINVGRMRINDQDVALVDLDDDMIYDVSVSDRNQNGEIEEDEVQDISEAQISVTDFAAAAMSQDSNQENEGDITYASNQEDDLAPGMPDYMNDADVSVV